MAEVTELWAVTMRYTVTGVGFRDIPMKFPMPSTGAKANAEARGRDQTSHMNTSNSTCVVLSSAFVSSIP